MGTVELVVLGLTAAAGMLGWFFAWRARGEAMEDQAAADEARKAVVDAAARAVTAETKYAAEQATSAGLRQQLDSERASKQALVDALAKAGAPVGPVIVDASINRLYADGDAGSPGADPGGDRPSVSGQASAAAAPSKPSS